MTMYLIPLRLNFFFLLHFNETLQIPGTCPLCSIHSATVPRHLPSGKHCRIIISSVQFSCSVMSYSLRPHECSMPGLPVHHKLPEFTQTQVHRVSDAIQPSHPLASPSPPAPNPSQHQSPFQ